MNETMPHDAAAEEAVLGSLLIDPPAIPRVAAILRPEDFYIVKNGWAYEAILAVGESADLLTVGQRLSAAGRLDEAGGEGWLAQLTTAVPTALNVEAYARTVADHALRRRVLGACSAIAKRAYDMSAPAGDIAASAYDALARATAGPSARRRVTLDEACDTLLADLASAESGSMPGAPTGIAALDRALSGLRPARLYVVAGLPGTGKTTLMLSMLIAAARAGRRAAMWSCEMSETEMLSVCVSHIAGVSLAPGDIAALSRDARAEHMRRVADAMQTVRALPISLIAAPGITPAQLVQEARAMQAARGLDVMAADYVQLMRAPQLARDATREQEVSSVAWGLKELAMALDVAVVAGSQVNDDGQLRESRAIEQHADAVLVLTTTERTGPARRVTASLRKNRGGPTRELELIYRPAAAHFGALRKEDQ